MRVQKNHVCFASNYVIVYISRLTFILLRAYVAKNQICYMIICHDCTLLDKSNKYVIHKGEKLTEKTVFEILRE